MSSPILERHTVFAAADRLLDAAAAGQGGGLFVVGEAGLGKTTVLDHITAKAAARFRVGVGRGDVAEAAVPFGLLEQSLEHISDGTLSWQRDNAGVASFLYVMLDQIRQAATAPLLLAFDDASWVDPDSLLVLRLLCRRIRRMPVAVVATLRPWPAAALRAAEELTLHGIAAMEELRPLTDEAALVMLQQRAANAEPAAARQAVELCEGNPFLLETAAARLRDGQPLVASGPAAATSWASRFLTSQLSGLTEAAQRYLRAASVVGRRFRTQIAADIVGIGPVATAQILDELAAAGILHATSGGWAEFRHALFRQAVYDLTAVSRASLHEAAFRTMRRRELKPAEVAEHALAAGMSGDRQAGEVLADAGREALAAGAVETARRYLEAAADMQGDAAPPDLLFDLGKALLACGDTTTALAIYEGLLSRCALSRTSRLAALRQLSRAAFHAGHIDRASAWLDQAVRESGERGPGHAGRGNGRARVAGLAGSRPRTRRSRSSPALATSPRRAAPPRSPRITCGASPPT